MRISKKDYHKKYKEIRNQILNNCRKSKKTYFKNFLIENANNVKNIWKGIKSIINIKTSLKGQPTSLLIKKELISEPKIVAETFNNYFSSIANELQGKIHHYGKDFSSYLTNSSPNNFFIKPTDKIEVIDIINNISITKATGPNSIPTDILHLIKLSIAEPLAV